MPRQPHPITAWHVCKKILLLFDDLISFLITTAPVVTFASFYPATPNHRSAPSTPPPPCRPCSIKPHHFRDHARYDDTPSPDFRPWPRFHLHLYNAPVNGERSLSFVNSPAPPSLRFAARLPSRLPPFFNSETRLRSCAAHANANSLSDTFVDHQRLTSLNATSHPRGSANDPHRPHFPLSRLFACNLACFYRQSSAGMLTRPPPVVAKPT